MAAGVLHRRSFRQIFGVPILLAIITAAGLLSALLGDGVWNALSWFVLSIPVAVIMFYAARPRRSMTIPSDRADVQSSRPRHRARTKRYGKGAR
jgi:hypothetical protein